jgi:hypothetical protein
MDTAFIHLIKTRTDAMSEQNKVNIFPSMVVVDNNENVRTVEKIYIGTQLKAIRKKKINP